MDFRSHLARSLDPRIRSNLLLIVLILIAAGIAFFLWLGGEPAEVFLAPVFTFVIWALLREVDPDHDWVALVGGALAGVWVLAGGAVMSVWPLAGLVFAARIITSTTGRRSLVLDLIGVSLFGIAIALTVAGWMAGFGIALALYLDDRFRGENRLQVIAASALTAAGATVVASLSNTFPETFPEVVQYVAVAAGLVVLILVVREPATPISQVDARHAAFLDKTRLHVSRSVTGILVFLMTILTGAAGEGIIVVIGALALAVISNEVELLRRRGR